MRKRSSKYNPRTDIRNKLIKDFYKTIEDKYPDYTYAQIEAACRAPYIQMKHELKKGTMREIRLPHIGSFTVKPSKIVGNLLKIDKWLEKGAITQERYDEIKEMMRRRIIIARPHFEEGIRTLNWDLSPWFDLENLENGNIRDTQQPGNTDAVDSAD